MTPTQRALARHALGLPNEMRRSYGNFYRCTRREEGDLWTEMVLHREALHYVAASWAYYLTRKGAELALDEGEQIDPEDFPPPIEVHINTRGCTKPLDQRTAEAIAKMLKLAHEELSREQREDFPELKKEPPAYLRKTAFEALAEYNSAKRRGEPYPPEPPEDFPAKRGA